MVLINILEYPLFILSLVCVVFAYLMSDMYKAYYKKSFDLHIHLEGAAMPMVLLGSYLLITSLSSQIIWGLSSVFDILFYDPLASFGLILISFFLVVKLKSKMVYVGIMSLMFGVMTIWYGIWGYMMSIAPNPIGFLILFVIFGAIGISFFPVTYIIDRFPMMENKIPKTWDAVLALLWVLLIAGAIASFSLAVYMSPLYMSYAL